MQSKSIYAIIAILFIALFYFLLSSFFAIGMAMPLIISFLSQVSRNPAILVSPELIGTTIVFAVLGIVWLIALIKLIRSVAGFMHERTAFFETMRDLDKELYNLGIFLKTAEKEFLSRRITQQTFDEIQKIAGKKMVEIKAKKKEITEEKEKKEQAKKEKTK
jgi:hypothetical protein